ncbi:formyltetrahydrofolate deformylase [Poriferisphaera sp. WC338]|uniref:formyltetrahydrofolate deformylase n=1 Tax=Poriferisphaera sp. WC338 TaxID=3425129 RepID=UPI003D81ACF0
MSQIKAVLNVIGRDQKGVVARFATFVAENQINILDIEQQVVNGEFIMDMLVDLAEMSLSLDELITKLLELGVEIDMQVRVTLHDQRRRKRVGVLVTKEAHCLEQMIADWKSSQYRGDIVCVLGNHPDLEPIATEAGLPFAYMSSKDKPAHFKWIQEQLKTHDVDLIALARYMQIVPEDMVQNFQHRIINIHPSLLPYFPGAKPYHQAWERGVRVTGCTAHFVTEDLDEGPTILQDVFHIDVGTDTAEDVREKGQLLEGAVLSNAVKMYLDEKLVVVDGKVVFRPGLSRFLDHTE